jgi:prefoldin alpha subunit
MESEKKEKTPDANDLYMQLQYLQQVYSQQYEVLNQSIDSYTAMQAVLNGNIEIIDNGKHLDNKQIFVGTEGGMYISAESKPLKSVITYIGAGYLVEQNLEDAKQFFQDKVTKGEELIKKLVAQRQKIRDELADINYRIGAIQSQGLV